MNVTPGATNQSVDVAIYDDTGLAVTGLVAATFPAVSWSLAGNTAATSISLSDLAAITTVYSSGGVKERSGGVYRLDIPNAALASAGTVKLIADATGKHLVCEPIIVGAAVNATQIGGTSAVQALLSVLYGCRTAGNVYVVDPVSGSNSNTGTWLAPLQNMYAKAIGGPAGAAVAGDVVLMLPGTQDIGTNVCIFNDGVRVIGVDEKACVVVGSHDSSANFQCQISPGSNGYLANFTYRSGVLNTFNIPIGFYGDGFTDLQGATNALVENVTIIAGTDCLYLDSGKCTSRLTARNMTFVSGWDYAAVEAGWSGGSSTLAIIENHLTIDGFTATINQMNRYALAVTGGAGTFTVTVNGQTTGAQAFNVSTANLQTAIQGLAAIGAYRAFVTGSASNYVILFPPDVGNPAVTAVGSGGAAPTVTVTNQWPTPTGNPSIGSHSISDAGVGGKTSNTQRNGLVRINYANSSAPNFGTAFYAQGANATINLDTVDLQMTFSGSGTRADLRATANGTIVHNRCSFDATHNSTSTGGTITNVSIAATLAATQSFNNTGQTTALPTTETVPGYVALNQNTGSADSLTILSAGNPVIGATIRVFLKTAYAGNPATAACLGATTSDSLGHWASPVFVPPGATYAIVVSAAGDQTQEVDVTV